MVIKIGRFIKQRAEADRMNKINRINGIEGVTADGGRNGTGTQQPSEGSDVANPALPPIETFALALRSCVYTDNVDGVRGLYDRLMELHSQDGSGAQVQRKRARAVKCYLDFASLVADIMMARGVNAETAVAIAQVLPPNVMGAVRTFYRSVVGEFLHDSHYNQAEWN